MCVKRLDLSDERFPGTRGEAVQFVRRPAEQLGELEQRERPLLRGWRWPRLKPRAEAIAQLRERSGVAQRFPRHVRECEPFQNQPDRDELVEAARRGRRRDAVGPFLDVSDHAAPPAEWEQRRTEEVVPLRLRDSERGQRLACGFEGRDAGILESGELARQPAQPGVGGADWPAVE